MFKLKEIAHILVASLVLAFAITLLETKEMFLFILISVFIIILINILVKKITAYYLESEIETRLWEIESMGLLGALTGGAVHPSQKFRYPFQAGIFFPIISKLIFFSINSFVWMAALTFDVKTKIYKSAKRHNSIYSFSEITEYQIGVIATMGLIANLVFAGIGYLFALPPEMNFVKLSIVYVFFNLLPLSTLDGNKIYFGNDIMWYTLEIFSLVGLGYAFFII